MNKRKIKFHSDRLFAALNKYWRPLTWKEYYEGLDINDIKNAITVSMMPKEVADWIWEKERKPFEVFK